MVKDEVFLDCGVLDGGTIKAFSDFASGKYSKIYGFESDEKSFDRTLEYLHEQKIERVEMINRGVWSEKAVLSFSAWGDGSSHISDSGAVKIPIITIDESVGDDLATFIKMDIEGTELEALRGVRETITRYKPRLAICVYHKPEDILEIPLYIQSLIPDYRYFLRHHAIRKSESVLYALT